MHSNHNCKVDDFIMATYVAHGVDGEIVFPIEVIEAETDAEAIDKAHQSLYLKRRTCPLKLYQVPYYKTGMQAWREDDMRFVVDIDTLAL